MDAELFNFVGCKFYDFIMIVVIRVVTRDTAWMFESISITLSQTYVVCKNFCLLIKKVECILKI